LRVSLTRPRRRKEAVDITFPARPSGRILTLKNAAAKITAAREDAMTRKIIAGAIVLVGLPSVVAAQGAAPATRDAKALAGRDLFTQHCVVCHVKTLITAARTYGPSLSRESLGGQEEVLRAFISEGDSIMPGFKLSLQPEEIGSIVAYLKTVPSQPTVGGTSK
jgi:mono/diheme cytochrome c family protein